MKTLKNMGLAFAAAGGIVLVQDVSAAPPRGNSAGQEDVKKAVEIVQEDLKQLGEAQKLLAQAQGNLKAANKNLTAAKEKAEAEQERSVGLDKLLAEQKAARKELKDASEPILEELRKTDAYAQAKRRADAAKARIGGSKPGSSSAAQDSMAVTLLERETIENDPKTKPVKERVTAADKAVVEARGKIKSGVAIDNEVKTAELEIEKFRGELRQAQNYTAQLLQKAGYDQAVANREAQEAHLMQLMQRMRSGSRGRRR